MNPKFKAIQNAVTSKVGRQMLQVQKHSPALLFGAGVVGMVGTVVLASRATLKLETVLENGQSDLNKVREAEQLEGYSDLDRKKDTTTVYTKMAVEVCKLYGPAFVVGVASVAALTGSHHILNNRVIGLTAAYNVLDKGFKEYRGRVVEELGVEKDAQFRHGTEDVEIVEETAEGPVTKIEKRVKGKPSIYARYFDEHSTMWERAPHYNQTFLRGQQAFANDKLRAVGHVFLNEIYDALGLSRTPEGAVVGWLWDKGGDNYIDFGVFRNDVYQATKFVNGEEKSILLDFNVDGVIYDKI